MNEVIRAANYVGLHVSTWSPGDGMTRYRFHTEKASYDSGQELITCAGKKDALLFLRGYRYGREMGLKLCSNLWVDQLNG